MTLFEKSWDIHMREGLAENSLSQLEGGWQGRGGSVYKAGFWSCPLFLLRMRNVLDKSCRENRNTQFIFYNTFSKMVLFMRWCKNIF